ncbi:multidrug resistance protein fnx1 [Fusarium flagelliforme]|uniref:Multidrug resistance protein fnx1 n=1 Tax=Fusarium flagelliforme TaxID=2675880 RepID=A0A395MVI8_9HYPO|nr:multidrug resistance protein fnx1 [Fusarium flagelliforme]
MSEASPLLQPSSEATGYGTTSSAPPPSARPEEETTIISKDLSFARLAVILTTAWLGVFLGAADTTVIATLSAQISSEFNSLSLLSWLATAYLIGNAASQPISGRLTDIFGRGPGLVFCNLAFAAGNLLCGLATSQHAMILGRVVAGVGGGGLMSISMFLGSDLIPLRKRAIVSGVANLWYGAGTMVGAVCGGMLGDYSDNGWRVAFLVQVVPSLVSAVIAYVMIKVPPKQSDKSYIKRIDFGGVFLVTAFLASLVLGLSMGGNIVPWSHPLPITAIAVAVCLFVAFICCEVKVAQPIIPVRLLLNRTVLATCLSTRGDSATDAGLKIMPSSLGLIGALPLGYLMKKTGKYIGIIVSGIVTMIVGAIMFTLQDDISPTWMTCLAFLILSLGYNAVFSITQVACLAAVEHSQLAMVTSTISKFTIRSNLTSGLWDRFSDYPNAAAEIQHIRDDLTELKRLPDGWHEGVIKSLMVAFEHVWILILIWAVLALISITPIKQHKLYSTLERK